MMETFWSVLLKFFVSSRSVRSLTGVHNFALTEVLPLSVSLVHLETCSCSGSKSVLERLCCCRISSTPSQIMLTGQRRCIGLPCLQYDTTIRVASFSKKRCHGGCQNMVGHITTKSRSHHSCFTANSFDRPIKESFPYLLSLKSSSGFILPLFISKNSQSLPESSLMDNRGSYIL